MHRSIDAALRASWRFRQLIVPYDLTPVADLALMGHTLKAVQPIFPQFDGPFPAKGWPLSGFFADDALSLPVFPVGAVPPVAWQVAVFAARFLPSLALGVIT